MIVALFSLLASLAWTGLFAFRLWSLLRVPLLSRLSPPVPSRWPAVTLVSPACNEEATVGPALESLLAQDYPALDIVAVDDRSTDGTRRILDALAARHPRLAVVHVDSLREGWLGKVAAMQAGLERARGEWILFADADVHLHPGALAKLVSVALADGLDHLTLMPRFRTTGPLQGALMASFLGGYVQRARGWPAVRLADDLPAFGYGAFNLVRRAALDRTAGLDWLRLDVLDDLALGELLKRSGAPRGFLVADEGVGLTWYASLGQALRSFEKNFFGGVAGYSFGRAVAFAVLMPIVAAGPFLLLAQTHFPAWPILGLLAGVHVAGAAVGAIRLGIGFLHGLLAPIADLSGLVPMLRGAWRGWTDGTVSWRGTSYPLAALRAGQRVTFP